MRIGDRGPGKTIVDLQMMNELEPCPACGRSFNLGDPVVLACGAWEGPPRLIHEHEAVFNKKTSSYIERKCAEASRS
jgi:hypothetical protein